MFGYMVLLFIIWRLLDTLISLTAPTLIPYLGNFSYADTMFKYQLPDFVRSWSNFDGIFYIRIALNGYSQYEQAFFPLYPLLIRFLNPLFGNNSIITGLIITNVAFMGVLFFLPRYLKLFSYSSSQVKWFIGFLLAYPVSFYFGVMYTESIFLLLLILCLYSLYKSNFILAFLCGYLAGLTRINGIFLLIPIGFYLFPRIKDRSTKSYWTEIVKNRGGILVMLGPVLGLVSYCYYLWSTTGNPFYFFTAQEYFGAQRSTRIILLPQVIYRYIKIFITADWSFQYFVAILEFGFFITIFSVLLIDLIKLIRTKPYNYPRLGLNIFSFANLLLSTLTGTFTSIPRYSLLSISVFFVLSEIRNKALKIAIVSVFILWHIVLLGFFIQGYFIT